MSIVSNNASDSIRARYKRLIDLAINRSNTVLAAHLLMRARRELARA